MNGTVPGPLLFARYAFRPNELGFCGGDDDLALFQYTTSGVVDGGLLQLERQFEGAYPYLQLIARANNIADPLDAQVVDAYWVGNSLLDNVDMGLLFDSMKTRFKARTKPGDWNWLVTKIPAGARPHHSFHVFEIYPRAGFMKSGAVTSHLFHTMEQCRIRWGQVTAVDGANLVVNVQPLVLRDGTLELATSQSETVQRWIDGKGFVDDVSPGQWVSIHWGWACDRLTAAQVANLERYTRHQVALCNQTM